MIFCVLIYESLRYPPEFLVMVKPFSYGSINLEAQKAPGLRSHCEAFMGTLLKGGCCGLEESCWTYQTARHKHRIAHSLRKHSTIRSQCQWLVFFLNVIFRAWYHLTTKFIYASLMEEPLFHLFQSVGKSR